MLSEIGEKNKITVTDDEVSRAVIERARQMPGREKEVWDYYRNNANALAQLRAPIYEDKVVDFILELANVTEKKVTREDLYQGRRGGEERRLTRVSPALRMRSESGVAAASVAMPVAANRASTAAAFNARFLPGLVTGKLAHICEPCLLSPASRDVRPRPAILSLPCRWMLRLRQPLGD